MTIIRDATENEEKKKGEELTCQEGGKRSEVLVVFPLDARQV
jgi:hypothetical protein